MERTQEVTSLIEALYLDQAISKQQVRRGLIRLCADFESLVELDNPRAARLLAGQMSDLTNINLL